MSLSIVSDIEFVCTVKSLRQLAEMLKRDMKEELAFPRYEGEGGEMSEVMTTTTTMTTT